MPKLSASKLWERCLDYLKVNVDEHEYNTWFVPIAFGSLDEANEMLVLRVPSHAIYEKLEKDTHLKRILYNVIWTVYKAKLRITYRVLVDSTTNATDDIKGTSGSTTTEQISPRTKLLKPTVQSELDSQLNDDYTFENFIEGTGNKLLRSIGLSIATNPKQLTFNTLFIYGSSGVGKTHLVNAIGIQFKRNFPEKRVLYVTANLFKVQFTTAVQQNKLNDFVYFYQSMDVIIIDDVQEFAGLQGTQQAFFHIFNHLKMNGKHIIMTSDREPAVLPGMEERLLTRFKWGLAAELEKPDYELCRKILLSKIQQHGLDVSDEVVDYLAANTGNSIRDLEGLLSSLMAHALVYNQDIDMTIAQQVVSKAMSLSKKNVTIDMIIDKVCNYFDVSDSDVIAKGRLAHIVLVRQLIMYLAEKHAKMTASKIGLRIGGRNHATVIHAVKQIKNRLASDREFAQKVAEVEGILNYSAS